MLRLRFLVLLVVMCLLGVSIAGCKGPAAQSEQTGGIINVGVTYDTPSMDNLTSGTTFTAQAVIFDTLVVRGPDGNYYPDVAESWEVSDDSLQWTFTLREGIEYHDGTKLTAETVKWFFDKARDPNGTHAFSDSYASVKEIQAPDDTTLIFVLEKPMPNLLFTVSTTFAGLISPEAYAKYGADYGTKYAVGSGPFKLEEWVPQEKTTVIRNEDYTWGPEFMDNKKAPYIERIVYKFFPETTTRVAELETGGLDILYSVPQQDLQRIIDSNKFDIYYMPRWGGNLIYIDMNQSKEPLGDLRIRQAINYAIDREQIAAKVFGDFAVPAYGYMAPHWNCGLADPKSIFPVYDPEKAKQLLDEAGWKDTDGDTIVDKDGNPLTLSFFLRPTSEFTMTGEILQSQLAAVGIKVEITVQENSATVEYMKANENVLALQQWGWDDSDVYNLFFPSSQIPFLNSSHIDSPDLDALLEDANTAPTREAQCVAWGEVERYAIENSVWAPIVFVSEAVAVNKELQNLNVSPYGIFYNDVKITQ